MEQWVIAAKNGEQAAWSALYQHYYPMLFAQALQLCKTQASAKDAVQDSLVTAYLKLDQLRNAATFGAWLRKILVHTCYRMQQKNRRDIPAGEMPALSDRYWEDSINNHTEYLAEKNRLYAAVARLPEALRSALMLRYFSGHQSYEEIASILAIPVGTVRSRLNQSKVKLAEHWNELQDARNANNRRNEEWNQFYVSHFGGVHRHDDVKDRLLKHFDKNMELVFTSGKSANGRGLIEKEVYDDREHGSWFEPVNAMSSGNISILEAQNFNSPEFPDRCPPKVVFVLYRNGATANKVHFSLR